MSALRRDLLERRLWPLVVLLLVAVVAVPVLALKHPSATAATAAAPPHMALPGGLTSASAATDPAPTVPPGAPRNPFASSTPKLASTPSAPLGRAATSSSSATASSSSASSATAVTAATVTPTPSTTGSASTTASTGSTPTTASTGSPSAPDTSSANASTAARSSGASGTQATAQASSQSWTIYAVDLRAGTNANAPLRRNMPRLALLPSAKQPELMFMGVLAGGQKAVFALAAGVQHQGPGECRPHKQMCSAILLSAGQTERLTFPSAASGQQQQLILRLVGVRSSVTHSPSAALAAYERHSAAGLCDLDLTQPMSYNQSKGTLSGVAGASCKDQREAIPFPFAATSQ